MIISIRDADFPAETDQKLEKVFTAIQKLLFPTAPIILVEAAHFPDSYGFERNLRQSGEVNTGKIAETLMPL